MKILFFQQTCVKLSRCDVICTHLIACLFVVVVVVAAAVVVVL